MKLHVINSGSEANCYVLENDTEALVIECGCNLMSVKKAIGFDVKKIKGCICSHSHFDHSKYVEDFSKHGISVYKPWLFDESQVVKSTLNFGNFTIRPVKMIHDVPCYGYYIKHPDMGRLLFATDTEYIPQNYSKVKLNHILIEDNYLPELVSEEFANYEHKLLGHMAHPTTLKAVEVNASDELKSVLLLHLGGGTSEPKRMVEDVMNIVDAKVHVDYARKGLTIDLSRIDCPF